MPTLLLSAPLTAPQFFLVLYCLFSLFILIGSILCLKDNYWDRIPLGDILAAIGFAIVSPILLLGAIYCVIQNEIQNPGYLRSCTMRW